MPEVSLKLKTIEVGSSLLEGCRKQMTEDRRPNDNFQFLGLPQELAVNHAAYLLLLLIGPNAPTTPREIGSSWKEIAFMLKATMASNSAKSNKVIAKYKQQKDTIKQPQSRISEFLGKTRVNLTLRKSPFGRNLLNEINQIQTNRNRLMDVLFTT